MASKLEAALSLAAQGFKVFPIAAGKKAPPLLNGWPEKATSDPKEVELLWRAVPSANIGIHCEGLVVIDVDVKKGGDHSLAKMDLVEGLPATRITNTPSGGRHVFFRLPPGHPGAPNGVDVLGPGLDIRSAHGYVVAPGSTVDAGAYAVGVDAPIASAPQWLLDRVGRADVRRLGGVNNPADVPDAPDAALERARDWLRNAERSVKGQGGDQAAFRVACRLRDLGVSYQQACDLMRSEAWDHGCGWRDGWLEEKPIRSAYRYAQNEESGSRGVVETDLPLPQTMPELSEKHPQIADKKKHKSRLIRADEYANEEGSAPGYIIKNLFNRASYAVGFGSPGAGKTFVFLDAGYHVANSKPWMGLNVRGGPVLYLAYEGIGGLKKRAKALQKKYGDNLGPLYIVGATMNLRELAGRQELGHILAEMPAPPVLIVIDTFARALMGGDENSAQDVGAFNDAIAKLIDSTGACVILIHHSGKNKAAGARGSSAILGAIDTEVEIDGGAVRPSKQRDVELLPPIAFKLRPVVVGIDEDMDEEKSCVVEPSALTRDNRPLPPKAEHAFSILVEMTGQENAPVLRSRWIAKMQEEGFGRSAAHDWARKLLKHGRIEVEGETVRRRLA